MTPESPPRKKRYVKPTGARRGLLIIHTGDGKGKTTAALGLAVRALGRGKSVRFFQFMKVGVVRFGEHRALEKLELKLEGLGDGFSWKSKNLEQSAALARAGWLRAAQAIAGGDHFLIVLDEMTYPLIYGWIPLEPVLEALRTRPAHVHVVVTGRRCPTALIEIADTVTEMKLIKHAFKAGIPAQQGIEH
jgi:cob(I)alamin adenosyltransferase